MARQVTCKDCIAGGITTIRKPALTRAGNPVAGKRCVTHERARKSKTRDSAWERRLMALYGITADEYRRLLAHQGNTCFICQRATGARKRLAVDHDHSTGFVRSILCSPCNKMLGRLRDDPEAFRRAAKCLERPPAWAVIGKRVAPIELPNLTSNREEDDGHQRLPA